jgi:predicted GTPase
MPYGDLSSERVQRFASMEDLDAARVTLEEREDYEPHLDAGLTVWGGVDTRAVLRAAESEADVVVWDGGNNDLPFVRPALWVTLVDPHRLGHETGYHPGEANFRSADVVLVGKADTAPPGSIEALRRAAALACPRATFVVARSEITVDDPSKVRGRRVLVVEDGPTLTHGEMRSGAGLVAATRLGAREVVDPWPFAVGRIAALRERWPHLGLALPAVGYRPEEVRDLEETLRRADCDTILVATPANLGHVLRIDRPWTRVRYELADLGPPTLADALEGFLAREGR